MINIFCGSRRKGSAMGESIASWRWDGAGDVPAPELGMLGTGWTSIVVLNSTNKTPKFRPYPD